MPSLFLLSKETGYILDPFAGTGTTGHAVLQLNKETNSTRQFILIEQGNPKNGDTFAKTLLYPRLKAVVTEMEREELIDAILSTQLNATPLSSNYLVAKNEKNEGIYLI
ncbi:3259_t:CDS:2 [Funneliformis geosporum]|nr:3259_t:CDS:2 [Funneliformis geosporum]